MPNALHDKPKYCAVAVRAKLGDHHTIRNTAVRGGWIMVISGLARADGLNFWPPAIWALGVAVVLAVVVFVRVTPENLSHHEPRWWPGRLFGDKPRSWLGRLLGEVNAPDAWSPQGSWTTNITAVGAVLGTVAGTTNVLQSYIPNSGAFVAVSLVFGGAAVLAPVIYAALATSVSITDPGGAESGALGTVGGLLLAAIFTLFGFFGEIFVTLAVAIHAVGGRPGPEAFFWASIIITASLVAIYAYRSLEDMIVYPVATAAAAAEGAAPKQAAPEQEPRKGPSQPRPLSRISSKRNASATL